MWKSKEGLNVSSAVFGLEETRMFWQLLAFPRLSETATSFPLMSAEYFPTKSVPSVIVSPVTHSSSQHRFQKE